MSSLLLLTMLTAELSAEFWGRTVPLKNGEGEMKAVASEHHLVVEVTVKAAKGEAVRVNNGQFRLRVNGAKLAIGPDSPGMAASAIYYPDWNGRQGLEAQAGPVIVGRPAPRGRFPDDPAARGNPEAQDSGESLSQAMVRAALPEGDVVKERTGLLYFAWKGRVAKLKSLELLWNDGGEERVVKLR